LRLVPLFAIVLIAWALILAEAYFFFEVIVDYVPPIAVLGTFTVLSLLKIALTFSLGAIWFVVIGAITRLYARSKRKSPTPSASS
jgi:hypothetical protein